MGRMALCNGSQPNQTGEVAPSHNWRESERPMCPANYLSSSICLSRVRVRRHLQNPTELSSG